jgi:hypothetical protein
MATLENLSNSDLNFEKPGKYSVSATSNFVIKNTSKIPASTFHLKTDPTLFEVTK